MRAVEVLCFGEMGIVLNSPRPFDITKLLDRRVILELDALTNADKTFLIESLLLWIHHYRMGRPQREEFRHAIVIEEAHHILLRKKQEVTGEETVTDVLLREIRELGIRGNSGDTILNYCPFVSGPLGRVFLAAGRGRAGVPGA